MKNLDVILVSAKCDVKSWLTRPISTGISKSIQLQLADTYAGNKYDLNHAAIYMNGRIYEFHLTGMRSESERTYFDNRHNYYIASHVAVETMGPLEHLTKYARACDWLGSVEDSPKKYDSLLCLKLLYAIRKNKLNMIKKDFDCKYICSEFVQKCLEHTLGIELSSTIMLPNDFQGTDWHFRKMRMVEHV